MVPDRITASYGWRAWHVRDGQLYPLIKNTLPLPKEAVAATCLEKLHSEAETPHLDCMCGFHAAKDPRELIGWIWRGRLMKPEPVVIGRVALWGRIIEGTQGFRSQYVYPTALYAYDPLPSYERSKLEATYKVAVHSRMEFKQAVKEGYAGVHLNHLARLLLPAIPLYGLSFLVATLAPDDNPYYTLLSLILSVGALWALVINASHPTAFTYLQARFTKHAPRPLWHPNIELHVVTLVCATLLTIYTFLNVLVLR